MIIVKPSVELEGLEFPVRFNTLSGAYEPILGASPEKVIERAGRTCYKSEDRITDDSHKTFIEMVCKKNHESVLEHSAATFRFVCDRGVSHEIVRHRLASYSQESTRYCNYSKDKFGNQITVIEPPGLTAEARMSWMSAVGTAEECYFAMLKEGASPQIARSILPTCLKTEVVMTANFREWCHFLKLRTSEAAHPQMREVANEVGKVLLLVAPSVFKWWNFIVEDENK